MNLRHQCKRTAARISFRPLRDAAFPICALFVFASLTVTTAIGCAWSFLNEHSVRFTGYTSPGEFTRLPPLPINPVARREGTPFARTNGEDAKYEAEERRETEINELWKRADEAEEREDFTQAGRLLREYLQRSSADDDVLPYGAGERQLQRNSAMDRLDALTALSQGVKPPALTSYLAIRREYDSVFLKPNMEWISEASAAKRLETLADKRAREPDQLNRQQSREDHQRFTA